jgi:hypothetical protein
VTTEPPVQSKLAIIIQQGKVVKALAYGSSIPHIDVGDVQTNEIVRLNDSEEAAIAELAEQSASARAAADILEREMAADAGKIIENFMAKAAQGRPDKEKHGEVTRQS